MSNLNPKFLKKIKDVTELLETDDCLVQLDGIAKLMTYALEFKNSSPERSACWVLLKKSVFSPIDVEFASSSKASNAQTLATHAGDAMLVLAGEDLWSVSYVVQELIGLIIAHEIELTSQFDVQIMKRCIELCICKKSDISLSDIISKFSITRPYCLEFALNYLSDGALGIISLPGLSTRISFVEMFANSLPLTLSFRSPNSNALHAQMTPESSSILLSGLQKFVSLSNLKFDSSDEWAVAVSQISEIVKEKILQSPFLSDQTFLAALNTLASIENKNSNINVQLATLTRSLRCRLQGGDCSSLLLEFERYSTFVAEDAFIIVSACSFLLWSNISIGTSGTQSAVSLLRTISRALLMIREKCERALLACLLLPSLLLTEQHVDESNNLLSTELVSLMQIVNQDISDCWAQHSVPHLTTSLPLNFRNSPLGLIFEMISQIMIPPSDHAPTALADAFSVTYAGTENEVASFIFCARSLHPSTSIRSQALMQLFRLLFVSPSAPRRVIPLLYKLIPIEPNKCLREAASVLLSRMSSVKHAVPAAYRSLQAAAADSHVSECRIAQAAIYFIFGSHVPGEKIFKDFFLPLEAKISSFSYHDQLLLADGLLLVAREGRSHASVFQNFTLRLFKETAHPIVGASCVRACTAFFATSPTNDCMKNLVSPLVSLLSSSLPSPLQTTITNLVGVVLKVQVLPKVVLSFAKMSARQKFDDQGALATESDSVKPVLTASDIEIIQLLAKVADPSSAFAPAAKAVALSSLCPLIVTAHSETSVSIGLSNAKGSLEMAASISDTRDRKPGVSEVSAQVEIEDDDDVIRWTADRAAAQATVVAVEEWIMHIDNWSSPARLILTFLSCPEGSEALSGYRKVISACIAGERIILGRRTIEGATRNGDSSFDHPALAILNKTFLNILKKNEYHINSGSCIALLDTFMKSAKCPTVSKHTLEMAAIQAKSGTSRKGERQAALDKDALVASKNLTHAKKWIDSQIEKFQWRSHGLMSSLLFPGNVRIWKIFLNRLIREGDISNQASDMVSHLKERFESAIIKEGPEVTLNSGLALVSFARCIPVVFEEVSEFFMNVFQNIWSKRLENEDVSSKEAASVILCISALNSSRKVDNFIDKILEILSAALKSPNSFDVEILAAIPYALLSEIEFSSKNGEEQMKRLISLSNNQTYIKNTAIDVAIHHSIALGLYFLGHLQPSPETIELAKDLMNQLGEKLMSFPLSSSSTDQPALLPLAVAVPIIINGECENSHVEDIILHISKLVDNCMVNRLCNNPNVTIEGLNLLAVSHFLSDMNAVLGNASFRDEQSLASKAYSSHLQASMSRLYFGCVSTLSSSAAPKLAAAPFRHLACANLLSLDTRVVPSITGSWGIPYPAEHPSSEAVSSFFSFSENGGCGLPTACLSIMRANLGISNQTAIDSGVGNGDKKKAVKKTANKHKSGIFGMNKKQADMEDETSSSNSSDDSESDSEIYEEKNKKILLNSSFSSPINDNVTAPALSTMTLERSHPVAGILSGLVLQQVKSSKNQNIVNNSLAAMPKAMRESLLYLSLAFLLLRPGQTRPSGSHDTQPFMQARNSFTANSTPSEQLRTVDALLRTHSASVSSLHTAVIFESLAAIPDALPCLHLSDLLSSFVSHSSASEQVVLATFRFAATHCHRDPALTFIFSFGINKVISASSSFRSEFCVSLAKSATSMPRKALLDCLSFLLNSLKSPLADPHSWVCLVITVKNLIASMHKRTTRAASLSKSRLDRGAVLAVDSHPDEVKRLAKLLMEETIKHFITNLISAINKCAKLENIPTDIFCWIGRTKNGTLWPLWFAIAELIKQFVDTGIFVGAVTISNTSIYSPVYLASNLFEVSLPSSVKSLLAVSCSPWRLPSAPNIDVSGCNAFTVSSSTFSGLVTNESDVSPDVRAQVLAGYAAVLSHHPPSLVIALKALASLSCSENQNRDSPNVKAVACAIIKAAASPFSLSSLGMTPVTSSQSHWSDNLSSLSDSSSVSQLNLFEEMGEPMHVSAACSELSERLLSDSHYLPQEAGLCPTQHAELTLETADVLPTNLVVAPAILFSLTRGLQSINRGAKGEILGRSVLHDHASSDFFVDLQAAEAVLSLTTDFHVEISEVRLRRSAILRRFPDKLLKDLVALMVENKMLIGNQQQNDNSSISSSCMNCIEWSFECVDSRLQRLEKVTGASAEEMKSIVKNLYNHVVKTS